MGVESQCLLKATYLTEGMALCLIVFVCIYQSISLGITSLLSIIAALTQCRKLYQFSLNMAYSTHHIFTTKMQCIHK